MTLRKVAEWMNSLLRKRITLSCLVFALLSVIWWLLHETYVLRCINRTQHKIFFNKIMSPGDAFTFKFIHFVEKTPVYEIFTIDQEGNIIPVETRVMSLGCGLPASIPKDHHRQRMLFRLLPI